MNRFDSWSKLLRRQAWIAQIRANTRAVAGWALIGLGMVGLVLPVIPGVLLIVIGCGLAGQRYAWVERLAAPFYQAMASIPVQKLHPALQSLRIQPPAERQRSDHRRE